MKRLTIGRKVRITDPVHIAARFWNRDTNSIVGAGGQSIPRNLLDGDCFVVSLAHKCKGQRGLIAFGSMESNQAMWLDIFALEKA